MTRKHFIDIAEALRVSEAPDRVIEAVAVACRRHNGAFSWDRFARAAGHSEFRVAA